MDNRLSGKILRQSVSAQGESIGLLPENEQASFKPRVGQGPEVLADFLYTRYQRFRIIGRGNKHYGDVYVLSDRYVEVPEALHDLECVKVVAY